MMLNILYMYPKLILHYKRLQCITDFEILSLRVPKHSELEQSFLKLIESLSPPMFNRSDQNLISRSQNLFYENDVISKQVSLGLI